MKSKRLHFPKPLFSWLRRGLPGDAAIRSLSRPSGQWWATSAGSFGPTPVTAKDRAITGRHLFGHQAKPCGKVSPFCKSSSVANRSNRRARNDRADMPGAVISCRQLTSARAQGWIVEPLGLLCFRKCAWLRRTGPCLLSGSNFQVNHALSTPQCLRLRTVRSISSKGLRSRVGALSQSNEKPLRTFREERIRRERHRVWSEKYSLENGLSIVTAGPSAREAK